MRYSYAGWAVIAFLSWTAAAAEKKLPIEQTSNEVLDISATVLVDRDQIKQEIGADPGSDIVVARVTVRPVSDKPVTLSLDDFYLFSSKDGQKSLPYAPTQIAGSATLVVSSSGARNGGGLMNNPSGPTWGGIPGTGGQPRRMGGPGGGVGNSNSEASGDTKTESKTSDKLNPLLSALEAKVLPEKEIKESTSGLLYFQIDGKVKSKDLELHYKGPAGKLALRFRP